MLSASTEFVISNHVGCLSGWMGHTLQWPLRPGQMGPQAKEGLQCDRAKGRPLCVESIPCADSRGKCGQPDGEQSGRHLCEETRWKAKPVNTGQGNAYNGLGSTESSPLLSSLYSSSAELCSRHSEITRSQLVVAELVGLPLDMQAVGVPRLGFTGNPKTM